MAFHLTQSLTDLVLPSLQAMGIWAYWAIGAAALFEAFFLTGVVLPGSILVALGGVLVHRGMLDFVDLIWFVAIGSWIGSYGSFWLGQRMAAGRGAKPHFDPSGSPTFAKALSLFQRYGAVAVLLGRFSGPVAGLVPFAAGMSGMPRRRFLLLSAVGAVPYAVVHVAIGYGASEVFARLSPAFAREAVALAAVLLVLALLWYVLARIIGLLPTMLVILMAALRGMMAEPSVARQIAAHPRLGSAVSARLSDTSFGGLPLTLTVVGLALVAALWAGSTIDYLSGDPIIRADRNIVSLLHSLQTPFGLALAARVTALGGWMVALGVTAASGLALWFLGHRAMAFGLAAATFGQTATVSLLKPLFGRIRPSVAHFTETSASFPSGHAAISIALFGFLAYAASRARLLTPRSAVPLAGFLIFSVGFSRMYLGEHYLSDAINGALLRNSRVPHDSPFPSYCQPTRMISAVPSALKRFMRA
ncbi:MAG: bifunctional DedA family/phosphatase PAP2 family protein, partial [Paracoccaceae bacterium]